jgi:hypothetical protein
MLDNLEFLGDDFSLTFAIRPHHEGFPICRKFVPTGEMEDATNGQRFDPKEHWEGVQYVIEETPGWTLCTFSYDIPHWTNQNTPALRARWHAFFHQCDTAFGPGNWHMTLANWKPFACLYLKISVQSLRGVTS